MVQLWYGNNIRSPLMIVHMTIMFDTPPQIEPGESTSSNMHMKNWWRARVYVVVKMSAVWRLEGTCGGAIYHHQRLQEQESTSICLVLLWMTGFTTIWISLVLSAWITVRWSWENPKSSEHAEDMAQYSASADDFET